MINVKFIVIIYLCIIKAFSINSLKPSELNLCNTTITCLYKHDQTANTIEVALQLCSNSNNDTLVEIWNSNMQKEVETFVRNINVSHPILINLDLRYDSKYYWYSGNKDEKNLQKVVGYRNNEFLHLQYNQNKHYQYNSSSGTTNLTFICRYPINECVKRKRRLIENKICVKIFNDMINYFSSMNYCLSDGGFLLYFEGINPQIFEKLLYTNVKYWFSFQKIHWYWKYGQFASYTNWDEEAISTFYKCVMLDKQTLKWKQTDCTGQIFTVICINVSRSAIKTQKVELYNTNETINFETDVIKTTQETETVSSLVSTVTKKETTPPTRFILSKKQLLIASVSTVLCFLICILYCILSPSKKVTSRFTETLSPYKVSVINSINEPSKKTIPMNSKTFTQFKRKRKNKPAKQEIILLDNLEKSNKKSTIIQTTNEQISKEIKQKPNQNKSTTVKKDKIINTWKKMKSPKSQTPKVNHT